MAEAGARSESLVDEVDQYSRGLPKTFTDVLSDLQEQLGGDLGTAMDQSFEPAPRKDEYSRVLRRDNGGGAGVPIDEAHLTEYPTWAETAKHLLSMV